MARCPRASRWSARSTSTSSCRCERLPERGETVGGGTFARVPGGKGANQAVACARLGAEVTMIAAVGRRPFAAGRSNALREAGSDARASTRSTSRRASQLVQVDGRARRRSPWRPVRTGLSARSSCPPHDAVLCQLEVPDEAVLAAWEALHRPLLPERRARATDRRWDADLTVVNRLELDALTRRDGLVALTLGAEGAVLLEDGQEIVRAAPPPVDAVDGTAAGDAFTACLLVSLLEERGEAESLRRACAAGAPRRIAARCAAVAPGAPPRSTRSSAPECGASHPPRMVSAPDNACVQVTQARRRSRRAKGACVEVTQALSGPLAAPPTIIAR